MKLFVKSNQKVLKVTKQMCISFIFVLGLKIKLMIVVVNYRVYKNKYRVLIIELISYQKVNLLHL